MERVPRPRPAPGRAAAQAAADGGPAQHLPPVPNGRRRLSLRQRRTRLPVCYLARCSTATDAADTARSFRISPPVIASRVQLICRISFGTKITLPGGILALSKRNHELSTDCA